MELYFSSSVGQTDAGQVDVEPDQSVRQLKEKVANQLVMGTDDINLLHNGAELPENRSIKKAGLSQGDTVKVIPNNAEGGAAPSGISSQLRRRLADDLARVKKAGIPLKPTRNPRVWRGKIAGQGRWKGQTFPMKVVFPTDYPDSPPRAYLLKMPRPPHPNIHPNGWVCVNHLYKSWQPHINVVAVYELAKWLFDHPNYDNPGHPGAVRPADWQPPRQDRPILPDSIWRLLR